MLVNNGFFNTSCPGFEISLCNLCVLCVTRPQVLLFLKRSFHAKAQRREACRAPSRVLCVYFAPLRLCARNLLVAAWLRCVSVVCFCSEFINHRDTENTKVAQRKAHRSHRLETNILAVMFRALLSLKGLRVCPETCVTLVFRATHPGRSVTGLSEAPGKTALAPPSASPFKRASKLE